MYGSPDKQTVGGAVVSFLLRPCSFCGLVVFGRRQGINPVFTAYFSWVGEPMSPEPDAPQKLVRKFLHAYGPATAEAFSSWLGCSGQQARRMWKMAQEEMEPVSVLGKKAFILSDDRERLFSSPSFMRELLLLGGHDPYLDQRDRMVLQADRARQKQIWRLVGNPGAVIYRGEVIGIWNSKKKGRGMEISFSLWSQPCEKGQLQNLAEEYAAFREQPLLQITL